MEKRSTIRKCVNAVIIVMLIVLPIVLVSSIIDEVFAKDAGKETEGYFVGDVEPVVDEYGYDIEGEYIIDGYLYEMERNGTVIFEKSSGEEYERNWVAIVILCTIVILTLIALYYIWREPVEVEDDEEF